MNRRVPRWLPVAVAALLAVGPAAAQPGAGLERLLQEVREYQALERERMAAREQAFLQRRDQAAQELAEAEAERERLGRARDQLRLQLDRLQGQLDEQQRRLQADAGDLQGVGELTRLVAAELRDRLRDSPTRLDVPQRDARLAALSATQGLPGPEQLQALWEHLLEDIALSGQLRPLRRPVTADSGLESDRDLLRVGTLHVISDGDYLQFQPRQGLLAVPPGQPPAQVRGLARAFQEGAGQRLALDLSDGQALTLAGQRRPWAERLRQGGGIGYVIIAIGVVGLLISLERLAVLAVLRRRMTAQRGGARAGGNPLARLQAAARAESGAEVETLALKLDETTLRELPPLRRGLSTLSVLAASAPLLGLLGTVAGMIQTFQVIAVFGSGDPKLMSGGISQALVTTELGLLVAIPMLLLHSHLSSQSNHLVQLLDEESARLVAEFAERRLGRPA